MAIDHTNKAPAVLATCCAKVYYDMENMGLQPGAEDWVRNPANIDELESLVKDTWVCECHGDPSEWPWNQSYILLEFIRERKKTRKEKDATKDRLAMGTLFPIPGGSIYFIRNSRTHIKIGWTGGDPVERMKALQTGESEPLTILGSIPGTEREERAFHVRFAAFRTAGGGEEWFYSHAELTDTIKELLDASN